MVMLAGALSLLAAHPGDWSGVVYGLFQPAEETGTGALAVVATGDGVVASRVDGAGDTAQALEEALGAAAAARGRMRAALVERLSSG